MILLPKNKKGIQLGQFTHRHKKKTDFHRNRDGTSLNPRLNFCDSFVFSLHSSATVHSDKPCFSLMFKR